MKDWIGNNNSVYMALGASNHTDKEREENDYYATEPTAIDKLFAVEDFDKNIWECACGEGHLSERIKQYGKIVYSSDLIDRGYQDKIFDFLQADKNSSVFSDKYDIITNPPYKYATEFVLKALEVLHTGSKVAMFLKLTFLEGKARFQKIFSSTPPRKFMSFQNGFYVPKMAILSI